MAEKDILGAYDQYLKEEYESDPFLTIGKAIGSAKPTQKLDTTDSLLFNFTQGLLSGGFNSYGKDNVASNIQEELVPTLSAMTPGVDYSSMFDSEDGFDPNLSRARLADALGDQESLADLQKTLITHQFKNMLESKRGDKTNPMRVSIENGNLVIEPYSTTGALPGVDDVKEAADAVGKDDIFNFLGEESFRESNDKRLRQLLATDVDPRSVGSILKDENATSIKTGTEIAKKSVSAGDQADKLDEVVTRAEMALKGAEPLIGPSIDKRLARFGAKNLPEFLNPYSDSANPNDALDSLQLLNSLKADIIGAARTPGTGSVSDYEDKTYLESGANESNTPDAMRSLIKRGREVAQFKRDKAIFSNYLIQQGVNPLAVEAGWDSINKQFPKYKKDKDGNITGVNENRPPIETILRSPKAALAVAQQVGGVETPKQQTSSVGGIPEGAVKTNRTSKGRPVYQLPDGRYWAGE